MFLKSRCPWSIVFQATVDARNFELEKVPREELTAMQKTSEAQDGLRRRNLHVLLGK